MGLRSTDETDCKSMFYSSADRLHLKLYEYIQTIFLNGRLALGKRSWARILMWRAIYITFYFKTHPNFIVIKIPKADSTLIINTY